MDDSTSRELIPTEDYDDDQFLSTAQKMRKKAIELLQNRSIKFPLSRIQRETGLPRGWVAEFGAGKIEDPSCDRLIKIYEYMSGRKVTF